MIQRRTLFAMIPWWLGQPLVTVTTTAAMDRHLPWHATEHHQSQPQRYSQHHPQQPKQQLRHNQTRQRELQHGIPSLEHVRHDEATMPYSSSLEIWKVAVHDHIKEGDDEQQQQQLSLQEKIDALLSTYQGDATIRVNNNNTAVIHIGPEKSGSTSLQRFMFQQRIRKSLSNVDHYARIPDDNLLFDKNWATCFDRVPEHYIRYPCHLDAVARTISLALQNNTNLIVTSETMSKSTFHVSKLYNFMAHYYNNVYIIAYYRRFFSWIVSIHNQMNKNKDIATRISLVDYLHDTSIITKKYYTNYFHGAIQRFQQYYDTNHIRYYHLDHLTDSLSLEEHFFCTAIPDTFHTCQRTRDIIAKEGLPNRSNGGVDFIYMDLAYYANEMNLLSADIPSTFGDAWIEKVATAVKYHQYHTLRLENSYDFGNINETVICPHQSTLDLLWNLTIATEQEYFPQYYNDSSIYHPDNQVFIEFQHYLDTYKFCHINATMILSNNYHRWNDYFRKLSVASISDPELYPIILS